MARDVAGDAGENADVTSGRTKSPDLQKLRGCTPGWPRQLSQIGQNPRGPRKTNGTSRLDWIKAPGVASNYAMAGKELILHAPIPPKEIVHRMETRTLSLECAARKCQEALRQVIPCNPGVADPGPLEQTGPAPSEPQEAVQGE